MSLTHWSQLVRDVNDEARVTCLKPGCFGHLKVLMSESVLTQQAFIARSPRSLQCLAETSVVSAFLKTEGDDRIESLWHFLNTWVCSGLILLTKTCSDILHCRNYGLSLLRKWFWSQWTQVRNHPGSGTPGEAFGRPWRRESQNGWGWKMQKMRISRNVWCFCSEGKLLTLLSSYIETWVCISTFMLTTSSSSWKLKGFDTLSWAFPG